MKYWWYFFLSGFITLISTSEKLFFWYEMEGKYPGTMNNFLEYVWWGTIVYLLVLMLIKWRHERKTRMIETNTREN